MATPSTGQLSSQDGEKIADTLLDAHDRALDQIGTHMLHDASKATRFVLRKIPGVPGFVYHATRMMTSDEPLREGLDAGGGMVGGAAGELLGMATGPAAIVTAPVGGVVGSAAGSDMADDYYNRHRARMDATNRWILQRRKDLFGR